MSVGDAPERSATLSSDRLYRYDLTRQWGTGSSVLWVMLNPSTADADVDDPTIRRVVDFTQRWGCDKAVVVNLFALRATDPRDMLAHPSPVGADNDEWIRHHASSAELIVAAWGVAAKGVRDRAAVVQTMLRPFGTLHCLERTVAGHPKHPLYVHSERKPQLWA